jgi:hypothetical protein
MAQNGSSTYLVTGGAAFVVPRSSDEARQLAIQRIIEWLAKRAGAEDDLKLPPEARPVLPK